MQGAKEFLERYMSDSEFAETVNKLRKEEKKQFCLDNGFEFTQDELSAAMDELKLNVNDVSGGSCCGRTCERGEGKCMYQDSCHNDC